jgi:hypothetical protein
LSGGNNCFFCSPSWATLFAYSLATNFVRELT